MIKSVKFFEDDSSVFWFSDGSKMQISHDLFHFRYFQDEKNTEFVIQEIEKCSSSYHGKLILGIEFLNLYLDDTYVTLSTITKERKMFKNSFRLISGFFVRKKKNFVFYEDGSIEWRCESRISSLTVSSSGGMFRLKYLAPVLPTISEQKQLYTFQTKLFSLYCLPKTMEEITRVLCDIIFENDEIDDGLKIEVKFPRSLEIPHRKSFKESLSMKEGEKRKQIKLKFEKDKLFIKRNNLYQLESDSKLLVLSPSEESFVYRGKNTMGTVQVRKYNKSTWNIIQTETIKEDFQNLLMFSQNQEIKKS